jgi:hypothetical protein
VGNLVKDVVSPLAHFAVDDQRKPTNFFFGSGKPSLTVFEAGSQRTIEASGTIENGMAGRSASQSVPVVVFILTAGRCRSVRMNFFEMAYSALRPTRSFAEGSACE